MGAEIDSLEIKITESTSGAEKRINDLIGNLNNLKQALSGISGRGLKGFVSQLNELGSAADKVSGTTKNLGELARAFQGLQGIGSTKINKNLGGQIRDLTDACGGFTDDVISRTERMSAALQGLNGLDLRGLKIPSNVLNASKNGATGAGQAQTPVAVDTAQETQRIGDASEEAAEKVSRLATALSGLRKIAGTIGSKAFSGIGAFLSKPFVDGFDAVKRYTGGLSKLGKAFSRILLYRTMRRVLKEIAEAFKTGVDNLYQWSKGLSGQFAASMDRAASTMQYFKNSVGAAVAPLVNALVPVLEIVVDAVVRVINAFNQLFALLTGASSWTRAVKGATEYAEATTGAGNAMKRLKDYTLGFDELNVFNDRPASGGGGGAAVPDYGSMFEEVTEFDPGLFDIVSKIKEAVSSGDWAGLGKYLGEKINEAFDPEKWSNLGEKIGGWIHAGVETLSNLVGTIDFTNVGGSLANALNKIFSQVDFKGLGNIWAKKFTILPSIIIGAIQKLDWGTIAKSLGNFFIGAFNSLKEWIYGIDWTAFGESVWTAITDFFANIDWAGLADSFFSFLGSAFGAIVQTLGSFFGDAFSAIGEWFKEQFTVAGEFSIEGLFEGILNMLAGLGNWILDHIVQPFIDAFCNLFGIHSPSTVMEELGENLIKGLFNGIKALIGAVGELFVGLWNGIKDVFAGAATWFYDTFIKPVGDFFSGLWEDVTGWASDAWEGIKSVFSAVTDFFADIFSKAWKAVISVFEVAGEIFVDIKDAIVEAFKFVVNAIIKGINAVMAWPFEKINDFLAWLRDISILGLTPFSGIKLIKIPQIPLLASGGLVESGQMFVARENGLPEMVGRIGSKTAVANNGQIEEGIARATERGNDNLIRALYAITGRLVGAIEDNAAIVTIGDDQIGRSNDRYQATRGTNGSKGAFANEL